MTIQKTLLIIAGFIAIGVISSCKKETIAIGLDIQGNGEKISISIDQSSKCRGYTLKSEDSLYHNPSRVIVGSLHDEIFGYSKSSFVSQIRPKYSTISITDTTIYWVDSVELFLVPKYIYGDTLSYQNLSVYQITQNISDFDVAHISQFDIADYKNNLISEPFTYRPNGKDTISISINKEIGSYLIEGRDYYHTDSLSLFYDYFKGLYITSDSVMSGGVLSSFDIGSLASRLLIYLRVKDDTITKTFDFILSSSCKSYNLFEESLNENIHINDSTGQDSLIYLKSMNGTYGYLTLPDLSPWFDSTNVVINNAEIILPIADSVFGLDDLYSPIPNIYLMGIDSDGEEVAIIDFYSTTSYESIPYNSSNRSYKISFPEHIQRIITGETTVTSFYIYSLNGTIIPNRTIINKGTNSENLKLYITYSRI